MSRMGRYTFERELDPSNEDYLKWFVFEEGICINERHPFDTEEQAFKWIPQYEDEAAERAWERRQEDGYFRGELDERHHNEQKLK